MLRGEFYMQWDYGLLVVGGLSVVGLGFLVFLGGTLGDVTGGALASGVIHLPMALFNAVNT